MINGRSVTNEKIKEKCKLLVLFQEQKERKKQDFISNNREYKVQGQNNVKM